MLFTVILLLYLISLVRQYSVKEIYSEINDQFVSKVTSNSASKMASEEDIRPNSNKGTIAVFLRENPRFLNEPICNLKSDEYCKEVSDCLVWKQNSNEDKRTCRSV